MFYSRILKHFKEYQNHRCLIGAKRFCQYVVDNEGEIVQEMSKTTVFKRSVSSQGKKMTTFMLKIMLRTNFWLQCIFLINMDFANLQS